MHFGNGDMENSCLVQTNLRATKHY